jgi:predicted esterase
MPDLEFKIQKTVRVSTYGNSNSPKYVWFALHGYGQLSPYFIKNFTHFDPESHFIVAPEGMHRFYLDGLSGRVGASWMTKEERLHDISDYISYLTEVYNSLVVPILSQNAVLIPFGFSQGVATLSRWMASLETPPKKAVFWAGSFPPDLEVEKIESAIKPIEVIVAIGSNDPFIDDETALLAQKRFEELGINARRFDFAGGHKIPKEALNNLFHKFLA